MRMAQDSGRKRAARRQIRAGTANGSAQTPPGAPADQNPKRCIRAVSDELVRPPGRAADNRKAQIRIQVCPQRLGGNVIDAQRSQQELWRQAAVREVDFYHGPPGASSVVIRAETAPANRLWFKLITGQEKNPTAIEGRSVRRCQALVMSNQSRRTGFESQQECSGRKSPTGLDRLSPLASMMSRNPRPYVRCRSTSRAHRSAKKKGRPAIGGSATALHMAKNAPAVRQRGCCSTSRPTISTGRNPLRAPPLKKSPRNFSARLCGP